MAQMQGDESQYHTYIDESYINEAKKVNSICNAMITSSQTETFTTGCLQNCNQLSLIGARYDVFSTRG